MSVSGDNAAYSVLARFYDYLMADTGYEKWLPDVKSAIGDRKTGADLACGSGRFTVPLKSAGYDVYGVDISVEMLNAARERARGGGFDITFVNADMTRFSPPSAVDFITVICDGVNYVRGLDGFFKRLYGALNAGGLLLFDVSSPYKLKNILGGNTFARNEETFSYVWENSFRNGRLTADLTFFIRNGGDTYDKYCERHIQYAHSESDLSSALSAAGFCRVDVRDGYGGKPAGETAERLAFYAYKPFGRDLTRGG